MSVVPTVGDFTTLQCVAEVDGVLMANALHFVPRQGDLLRRLRESTKTLVIVEYERQRPSHWEPFPIGFNTLAALAAEAGFPRVTQIGRRPSAFGGHMYSALAQAPISSRHP